MSPERHSSSDPYRFQFEALLAFHEEQNRDEREKLFERLLHRGPEIFDSLANFTLEQPNHARLSVLLELMGKLGEVRAVPILMRYLVNDLAELRAQAATALGWLRARAALETLDGIEAHDASDDVRREAAVAIEEILRVFPRLRPMLKHHRTLSISAQPVRHDSDDDIARMTPPGGHERTRLVGMFPRILAMRHKAVPLGLGPGGVVGFAVDPTVTPDPALTLKALVGREVELHGWPLQRIYDRIISFYKWGDEDWVLYGNELTEEAREAITELVLKTINPAQPAPALPDCMDAVEAAQGLLTLLAWEDYVSAHIEFTDGFGEFTLKLLDRDHQWSTVAPPPPSLQARLVTALEMLSGLYRPGAIDHTPHPGLLRIAHPGLKTPFVAVVRRERLDDRHLLAIDEIKTSNN